MSAGDGQVGGTPIQPWDVIDAFGLDFYQGNVIMAVLPTGRKADVDRLDDLRKARHYLDKVIEREETKGSALGSGAHDESGPELADSSTIRDAVWRGVAQMARVPPALIARQCTTVWQRPDGTITPCTYRPDHGRVPGVTLPPFDHAAFDHGNPEVGEYWLNDAEHSARRPIADISVLDQAAPQTDRSVTMAELYAEAESRQCSGLTYPTCSAQHYQYGKCAGTAGHLPVRGQENDFLVFDHAGSAWSGQWNGYIVVLDDQTEVSED